MTQRPPIRPAEQGYTIVTVLFLLALLSLSLAIAAPKMAREIQRDREVETMQRGKQYARAIKLYYKKNGSYPASVDALTKSGTGNIRYLRKKYLDPMSGKDDWKPVQVGQNKAPTAMGFFGQPLAGTSGTGVGSYGTGSIPGASTLGSSLTSPSGTDPSTQGATGATSTGAFSTGSNSTLTGASPTGATGPTFGGAGIMGFSPGVNKPSILVYKTKQRYNEWEFVYDPRAEQVKTGATVTGAKPAASAFGTTK